MKDLHEATQEALQNAMTESEDVIHRLQMLQQNNHAMRTLEQREWVGALLEDKQALHSLLEDIDAKLIELGKCVLKEDEEKAQALEDAERYRRLKVWVEEQTPESELGKLLPDDLDTFADSLPQTEPMTPLERLEAMIVRLDKQGMLTEVFFDKLVYAQAFIRCLTGFNMKARATWKVSNEEKE